MRDMAHSICLIKLYQITMRTKFRFFVSDYLEEMEFTLNKKEFHDALGLRYEWEINDIPSKCVCGERFDMNHVMICMKEDLLFKDIMS